MYVWCVPSSPFISPCQGIFGLHTFLVMLCLFNYFRNSAHVVLKQKLKSLQGEYKALTAALEVQCRENFKVSDVYIYNGCGKHA